VNAVKMKTKVTNFQDLMAQNKYYSFKREEQKIMRENQSKA
jgi:hypothetical protein